MANKAITSHSFNLMLVWNRLEVKVCEGPPAGTRTTFYTGKAICPGHQTPDVLGRVLPVWVAALTWIKDIVLD